MKTAIRCLILSLFVLSPLPALCLQTVDWRSFFHGEPAAPPKAPPPKQLAIVATAPDAPSDPQIENFLRALAGALMARDGTPLLSRLADQYTIDDLPADKKPRDFFLQAVERIPGPVTITVQSVEPRDGQRTAKIDFRYGMDNVKRKTFRFDAAGKLLWSDLFGLQRRHQGA